MAPTRLVTNSFRDAVEAAEDRGASAEELRELLGRGRAKKGIFEGDLEEGELEIFLTDDTQITLHAGFFESFERYEEFFALLKK